MQSGVRSAKSLVSVLARYCQQEKKVMSGMRIGSGEIFKTGY